MLSTCPIFVGFWPAFLGSTFCIIIDFHYDIKKLIMMQKLKLRIAGLKAMKRVILCCCENELHLSFLLANFFPCYHGA